MHFSRQDYYPYKSQVTPDGISLVSHGFFHGIVTNASGSAISVIKKNGAKSLMINQCSYRGCWSNNLGGAIYGEDVDISLVLSQFRKCRCGSQGDRFGGNIIYMKNTKFKVRCIEAIQCWRDINCGRSIFQSSSGRGEYMYINGSNSIDNSYGSLIDGCDLNGMIIGLFIQEIGLICSSGFMVSGGNKGLLHIDKACLVDNKYKGYLLDQNIAKLTVAHSCFFRNKCRGIGGQPKITGCYGDIGANGITMKLGHSTLDIEMDTNCKFAEPVFFSVNKERPEYGPIAILILSV